MFKNRELVEMESRLGLLESKTWLINTFTMCYKQYGYSDGQAIAIIKVMAIESSPVDPEKIEEWRLKCQAKYHLKYEEVQLYKSFMELIRKEKANYLLTFKV